MYKDLESFYHSKEWRKLVTRLKLERLDEYGQLTCAECGRPITRMYDAIGHHIKELTEENVFDATVSLNPENVEFLHLKCHNVRHNKLAYSTRQVFLVYGPPFAGKKTYVHEVMDEGDMIVDIDAIWQAVSGCEWGIKPNRLKAVVFGIRDAMIDAVKYRKGKWQTAWVIGGYPLSSERERLCKELGALEVLIVTDRETCLARLAETKLDKDAWTGYVNEWFERAGHPPLT